MAASTAPVSLRFPARVGVRAGSLRWALACALSVLPVAAILHHAVFYQTTCMLNPFGADYSLDVLALWLSRDPSLWIALLLGLAAFQLGNRVRGLRPLVLPFVVAFAPLALWIWDLPFSGRIICNLFHDERLVLMEGVALRSRHLYYLGGAFYGLFMARLAWLWLRSAAHRTQLHRLPAAAQVMGTLVR